jgi:hypothetical protein
MLTIQQRREYDDMFNTLQSDGWKYIQKRFTEAYDLQNDLMSLPDERTLHLAQGRLLTLGQFINLEDLLKAEMTQAELDSDDDGENELES